ncbi:hypothetical protein HZC09_05580 [Candidatus Micrarchaeota archaeon]|nr:hypothetical protein [Candidatus Micrarchaeota archaeon]
MAKGNLIFVPQPCLPEVFNTGYHLLEVAAHASSEHAEKRLKAAAIKFGMYIVAGMPEKAYGPPYNSAFLFDSKGNIAVIHRKNHLPSHVPNPPKIIEKNYFKTGTNANTFNTAFAPVGAIICFDLRFPDLSRKLAENGAEILLVIAAWAKKTAMLWRPLLKARAIENQCYVVGVDHCGKEDMQMAGQSVIYGPLGEELAGLDEKTEGVIVAEVDLDYVKKLRKSVPVLTSSP